MGCCCPLQVVLASWFRFYTGVMGFFGIPTKTCWSINRGEGLSPVDSCEGLTNTHTHTDTYSVGWFPGTLSKCLSWRSLLGSHKDSVGEDRTGENSQYLALWVELSAFNRVRRRRRCLHLLLFLPLLHEWAGFAGCWRTSGEPEAAGAMETQQSKLLQLQFWWVINV